MYSAIVGILCSFCLCFNAAFAGTSGGTSYYSTPECSSDSFYCQGSPSSMYSCLPHTQRCTTNDASSQCTSKEYEHCGYDQVSGTFSIMRHSTELLSLLSGRKRYELAHQFVTYRGLMYEYGEDYGAWVQDPSDPNYEYNTRPIKSSQTVGSSKCTYEQVLSYLSYWTSEDYNVFSKNCQDFASGLTEYLKSNCASLARGRRHSNTNLIENFFTTCKGNCMKTNPTNSAATVLDPDRSDTTTSNNRASTNET